MAYRLGLSVIFLNVLLEQLGVPVPAVPTLVLAGALAAAGRLPALPLFLLVLTACLIGDLAWYGAGRIFGGRVMRLLCRISLTPDTCVRETQANFERWGPKLLVVAKFIPGLALVAPPMAGATHMGAARFIGYSLLSGALWAGTALLAGALLRRQVLTLLPGLMALGGAVLALLLVLALLAYLAYRFWERRRFARALEMARISVAELNERLRSATPPVVIDVRLAGAQGADRQRIPGALLIPLPEVAAHVLSLPRDREIILYCNCPNEASAALAAKQLMRAGVGRVRPLRGGLDAWVAAGFAVEPPGAASAPVPVAPRALPSVG